MALEMGGRAPTFRFGTLDAQSFDFAILGGKVGVSNFWTTRCTSCRTEMPEPGAFYSRYRGKRAEKPSFN